MQNLMYVEINAFAFAVLFLIFLNVYHRAELYLTEQKLFTLLLCSNALILVLDTVMWVFDGKPGQFLRSILIFSTSLYYIMNPLICMIWSLYADFIICRNELRLKKLILPLALPAAVNTILSVLSVRNRLYFFFDANNIYHRGVLFTVMAGISYLYLIYTLFFIIRNQGRIEKQSLIPILFFAVPPFIGGIIQILYYGVSLIWVSMTISLLIVFINIQHDQLYTDYLTGLYNRRQLNNYLLQKTQPGSKKLLAGIMIDLDFFKRVNDVYGHLAGDQALIKTAEVLKATFGRSDFIARFGGDEFIVITEVADRAGLEAAVERLKANIKSCNDSNLTPYKLYISMGYDCFDAKTTLQDFLKHIDRLMYEDKLKHANIADSADRIE